MEDNFDAPAALSHLFNAATLIFSHLEKKEHDLDYLNEFKSELEKMLWVLGLQEDEAEMGELPGRLLDLMLELREMAREKKQFEISDRIRARLKELGIVVEDTEKGPRWRFEKTK
jgi:cysteinyl-tRNA synthetase